MNGIKLQNVSFAYQKDKKALKDLNLTIKRGSFLGITGINGSGKSTFTYLLNGLIPHLIQGSLEGEVTVDGVSTKKENVSFFARKVGFVFQNPESSLFNLTVEEEIGFALENLKIGSQKKRIKEALAETGLQGYEKRDPQSLSFGEKQKVCLATVLAMDTTYLVLDEPTAMLDYKSALELYQLLNKLHQKGKTIITVEHDTDFLYSFTKQLLILHAGKQAAFGKTKSVLSDKPLLKKLGIKIPHMSVTI